MTELKTQKNDANVKHFISSIEHEKRQADCKVIVQMIENISQLKPKMWGDSTIGFGQYHYKYASGREGDWFLMGVAPGKQNLSLHIMSGFSDHEGLMAKLGKYKTGRSCLYINKLEDINEDTLKELLSKSYDVMSQEGWG